MIMKWKSEFSVTLMMFLWLDIIICI